jgi:hypothetical protein
MSRRLIIAMLGFSLALFLMPQVTLAAEDHIAEAITHTKQAIDHGKMGHADILTTHAEAALTHAQAGEKAKANPHCKEATVSREPVSAFNSLLAGKFAGNLLFFRAIS